MLRSPVLGLIFVVGTAIGCGDSSPAACTALGIGAQCNQDSDCCSGYCDLEDMASFCQQKPAELPACIDADGFCTQDRNCCSGLCQNNACFGGSDTGSCLSLGSSCIQDDSCCSNNCLNDGLGHTACSEQPQPDSGPACGLPGTACSMPGQSDPTECCYGLCDPTGSCAGGTSGGGTNCGKTGAYCMFGSDCCSGQCETLSGGNSSCH
jgi:hypothetical protein